MTIRFCRPTFELMTIPIQIVNNPNSTCKSVSFRANGRHIVIFQAHTYTTFLSCIGFTLSLTDQPSRWAQLSERPVPLALLSVVRAECIDDARSSPLSWSLPLSEVCPPRFELEGADPGGLRETSCLRGAGRPWTLSFSGPVGPGISGRTASSEGSKRGDIVRLRSDGSQGTCPTPYLVR